MLKRFFKKLNRKEGSATVEAVVGFTAFLFAFFTILSLVNFCRAQMLISAAMDNAAKELSQYSYFYKMSGLQKFSKALGDKADVGKSHINQVVGSVDELYNSLVKATDDSVDAGKNIANATMNGTLNVEELQSTYNGLSADLENVGTNIDVMSAQFQNVGSNPMLYMKSLVAIASSKGLDMIKSHAIAAPLAKFFVRQQFGATDEEADAALKKLGVKDGLSGLNFKVSSLFSSEHPEDIRLVVFYKLNMFEMVNWEILEVNVSKQSVCRGWLAGDNPSAVELKDDLSSGAAAGDGSEESGEGGEGTDETTDGTESTESSENTEPTSEKVDTTGSYWHMSDEEKVAAAMTGNKGPEGNDFLHHLSTESGMPLPTVSNPDTLQKDNPKQLFQSYTITSGNEKTDSTIYISVLNSMKAIEQHLEAHDTEDTERTLYYEICVPENISDEDYELLEAEIEQAEDLIDQHIKVLNSDENTTGMTTAKNAEYKISIIKTGGNYDYGSEK